MIKMLCQVPRQSGMSETEFYPRYLTGHGALVRSLAEPMGFLRYVQAHRIASREIDVLTRERGWRRPLDGQSELWWGSWASMEAALGSPEGTDASALLEADERAFTDTTDVSAFIAKEETIFDVSDQSPPGMGPSVKMVVDIWKRRGMTTQEFSERWRNEHASLVRKHATAIGVTKYVQNHRDQESKFDFAELRGWQPAPDGVTEMWWPSIEAFQRAFGSTASAEANAALRADEERFLDPAKTRAFLGKEHSIFDFIEPVMSRQRAGTDR